MIAKLLPLLLLVFGSAAGAAVGHFLRPAPPPQELVEAEEDATPEAVQEEEPAAGAAFFKMNNQFVVPLVRRSEVNALVVLSLSLEVPEESSDQVFRNEPRLRDSFLRVLFDHANLGGFDGAFTSARNMDTLRRALKEIAQRDLGQDLIRDVLITEIARQDL